MAGDAREVRLPYLLELMVMFNIFIGIFNLIPLLPFDGGHVAIAIYERIRSRNGQRYYVDVAKLMPLTYMVVLVLGSAVPYVRLSRHHPRLRGLSVAGRRHVPSPQDPPDPCRQGRGRAATHRSRCSR